MSSRNWFRAVVSASLVVGATGGSRAAPLPDATTAKYDVAVEFEKFSAWDARCRSGMFDIRTVRGNDLPMNAETALSFACVALASSSPAPMSASGNLTVDEEANETVQVVSAIRRVVSGNESPGDALYRPLLKPGRPVDLAMKRWKLFFSVLRGKQGSGVLCRQAREMGIADEDFGCTPYMSIVDGRPAGCKGDLECRELAGLVAALRSREPKGCSASPLCKVLSSHDVRGCEPYLARADRMFCGNVAASLPKLKLQAAAAVQRKFEPGESARKALELQRLSQRQFKKGEPMQAIPLDVEKRMKKIGTAGQQGKKP